MKKAVFAGTFDPFTVGHLEIAETAAKLFGCVIVAVAEKSKSGVSESDRVLIAEKSLSGLENVKVVGFSGLLTDFMKENDCTILVRGLRNTIDFEYEKSLASVYKNMMPEIEICYLVSSNDKSGVSSTNVREIISCGGDASAYVESGAFELVKKLYQ